MLSATFSFSTPVLAESDFEGKLVKVNGVSSLYYVASDGGRYVFPNEKTYKTWFSDFNNIMTLTQEEIQQIPLRGNVLYRPGIVLVKITTDPRIYAVSQNGILRWIETGEIAEALYGPDWTKLIDDVPDSFFVNYEIGESIDSPADYDPDQEVEEVQTIEANRNLSTGQARLANTFRCHIIASVRECNSRSDTAPNNDSNDDDNNTDNDSPYITAINISNGGGDGRIDVDDTITITFSEEINPGSIHGSLVKGDKIEGINYSSPGGVKVYSSGKVLIDSIASFDVGAVGDTQTFTAKLSLSTTGKVLTITLTGGNDLEIINEDIDDAVQIGGKIEDLEGNVMQSDSTLNDPTGTFGGDIDDGASPYIKSIELENGGEEGFIDVDDSIVITFSEPIDPQSVDSNLDEDEYIGAVEESETGGVAIYSGEVTITDIATFYVGSISGSGAFISKVALNEEGDTLTITLTKGNSIEIFEEDFNSASQTGGTITDKRGNKMKGDSSISDPTGTFGGDNINEESEENPYISSIHVSNGGRDGYIDINDTITITFSEPIDPNTIHTSLDEGDFVVDIHYTKNGGIEVTSSGEVIIKNITRFDMGGVEQSGIFTTKLALNSSGKVLTITITQGDDLQISKENFNNAVQIGGTIEDWEGNEMNSDASIVEPTGTFGGVFGAEEDFDGFDPEIESIVVANGGEAGYVDINDTIAITFSEPIDPQSINNNLEEGEYVVGVSYLATGGVSMFSTGLMIIEDIARFDIGSVVNSAVFDAKLSLNAEGDVLTITLISGSGVQVTTASFGDSNQIGGVIEDRSGNEMNNDSNINSPIGVF